MASMNPFDLLGDDAEDPSQLAAALPKKIEKAAPVQSAKAGKMPTKPLPPSEAVRESKNASSGGRGGGGRGYSRGGGGGGGRGFNRDYRNNDAPGNENGYSGGGGGGYRPSEDADGARRGTVVGGFRGGRGGGRRGFPNGGESGDVERPRRTYERRSGTGRGNDLKREGGGRGNWGTTEDDVPPVTEEPTTEVEKSPVAEKQGGEDETADASKEVSAEEQEKKEAEDKEMTLEEYEKILEEKKKALQATKVEERKVDTKVFESMQQLSNKKNTEEEIFVKLGSDKDKRKDAAEKAKKSVNIHEFLKPAEGESFRGGYRGRGRGPRGPRGGGGNGGGNPRYGGGPAPVIGDDAQFPSLGK
ncbi:RGG repeats nuclear RNA binding protein B [Cardamine amara subsp. amara]|uniref:RGG repeats nuclear RNA binding protein B n=1 Tax=Cardamine amara subsp. amara TaxID=228776 RepID=A0ABD1B599_CARAN